VGRTVGDNTASGGPALIAPVGIELRKGTRSESIRIKFMYLGAECRESLKLAHTKVNLKYVERLRGTIINEIERGTFEYAAHFPGSKAAHKFAKVVRAPTVGELLDTYAAIIRRTLAPNTLTTYLRNIERHRGMWGDTLACNLTPTMLKTWAGDLTTKANTAQQFLIPLRAALDLAVDDEVIAFNPLSRVKLKKVMPKEAFETDPVADPFSADEITAILAQFSGQERNVFAFAFATGMRPSEYIALDWDCIDFERNMIRVRRVLVEGKFRDVTKTKDGKRLIDIRRGALDALIAQKPNTQLAGGLVFHDPAYNAGWTGSARLLVRWKYALERAGVRYRKEYQTRHTFASTLLSTGVNDMYVAGQMGHKNVVMIQTTYGKWIEQEGGVLTEFFAQISPKLNRALK
jgi:integrase